MTLLEKLKDGLLELQREAPTYMGLPEKEYQEFYVRAKQVAQMLLAELSHLSTPDEDVKTVREALTVQRMKAEFIGYEGSQQQMQDALAALDRLALGADTERVRRETLEDLKWKLQEAQWVEPSLGRMNSVDKQKLKTVGDVIFLINQQLAAGKKERSDGA